MKVVIVFHSVCGNTYLMAKKMYQVFQEKQKDVVLLRVEDKTLERMTTIMPAAKDYLDEILALPVATPEDLLDVDLVCMGSPTYFGNVSGQMKTFMDSCGGLWVQGKFIGKKLVAFTSAGNSQGGGDQCLQAILTYAQHMGMLGVSIPSNLVEGMDIPAYGLLHYSGSKSNNRLSQGEVLIRALVDYLVS